MKVLCLLCFIFFSLNKISATECRSDYNLIVSYDQNKKLAKISSSTIGKEINCESNIDEFNSNFLLKISTSNNTREVAAKKFFIPKLSKDEAYNPENGINKVVPIRTKRRNYERILKIKLPQNNNEYSYKIISLENGNIIGQGKLLNEI